MKSIWIPVFAALLLIGLTPAWSQEPPPPPETETAQDALTEARDHADLFKDMKLPEGPMRVEPWAFMETRNYYKDDPPTGGVKSTLVFRTKLVGERLVYLAGRGEMIIEEMIDETGKTLLTTADFNPKELTKIYPLRAGKRMIQAGYAALQATGEAASRNARTLRTAKGYVNVVYAKRTEEILIDNPLQYVGGFLEHPKLKEIGLKIKVIDADGKFKETGSAPGLGLQFMDDCQKYIRMIDFYDAWLKPMYARERPMETPEGEEYVLYVSMVGKMDADTQLAIKYYPEIEEERVRFEFNELELP